MSTENIRLFFEQVKDNTELRGQIALIARLEAKSRIEALCKLSEQLKKPFTAEEFARSILKTGELSDTQLEGVTGGNDPEFDEMWAQDVAAMFGYHGP